MRTIYLLFFTLLTISSCKTDPEENAAEKSDFCDCEMLGINELSNHFYLENPNIPFSGICKLFHKNGQLKQEREIVDGKNNGYYRSYSDQGILLEEGFFKDNRHHGVFKYFDENGDLTVEAEYKNGVRKAGNLTE